MNIIILPLLIVNQLNLTNETWPHGPEIRYKVTYNASTLQPSDVTNGKDRVGLYNFEADLKCRPRGSKILNCRFEKPMGFVSFFNSSKEKLLVSPSDDGEEQLANYNFEIKFNRFGIKQLFVPSSISPRVLDMIRAIVNQFHTGIDLTEKSEGTYKAWENFTTGDCVTFYKVTQPGLNKSLDNQSKKWQPQWTTNIAKVRNVAKCRTTAPYFFGSRESWRDNPRLIIKLKSSESAISANATDFESVTETVLELENTKSLPSGTTMMSEKMSVTFECVVLADKEMEKINDRAAAGIVTGKWIHDDVSNESTSEE